MNPQKELLWSLRVEPKLCTCLKRERFRLKFAKTADLSLVQAGSTQRLQYPLIKEHSLNHSRDPIII